MTARQPLPVTLDLALALEATGDLFAAARRLAELDDPVLRPLTALLLDILSPVMAIGAVIEADGGRHIDQTAMMQFYMGAMGMDEAVVMRTRLFALAAAFDGWRAARSLPPATPPDAAFLAEMMRRYPDPHIERG